MHVRGMDGRDGRAGSWARARGGLTPPTKTGSVGVSGIRPATHWMAPRAGHRALGVCRPSGPLGPGGRHQGSPRVVQQPERLQIQMRYLYDEIAQRSSVWKCTATDVRPQASGLLRGCIRIAWCFSRGRAGVLLAVQGWAGQRMCRTDDGLCASALRRWSHTFLALS